MTIGVIEKRKQQRLTEVAREYRRKGYRVVTNPQQEQLPDFLAPFPVDLIAYSDTETVVVEVRTRSSLTKSPALDAIAEALVGKEQWRFELVVTNPKEHHTGTDEKMLLAQADVDYRLTEAKQLADQEYGEAAILLAWSALEAMLRRTAWNEQLGIAQETPDYLLKNLFAYGLLDREQLQILQDSLRTRNDIAHGYRPRDRLFPLLKKLLTVAHQLTDTRIAA